MGAFCFRMASGQLEPPAPSAAPGLLIMQCYACNPETLSKQPEPALSPALQQLRNRKDAARASLDVDPVTFSAQADFGAINRELGVVDHQNA